jgi:hypothetical protein
MTQEQIMSYIRKLKAQSKYTMYKGRRVKSFYVPGTEDFLNLKKARENLEILFK